MSNQHLPLSFSCTLVLLPCRHQWKCRWAITQGCYHFPAEIVVVFIQPFGNNPWGLQNFTVYCYQGHSNMGWLLQSIRRIRKHISCRAYCNINPIQQSMERAFGAVHWSFMAMRLQISLPNHACVLKYVKVILFPMKQHSTYRLGRFLTSTVFDSLPNLGLRMSD